MTHYICINNNKAIVKIYLPCGVELLGTNQGSGMKVFPGTLSGTLFFVFSILNIQTSQAETLTITLLTKGTGEPVAQATAVVLDTGEQAQSDQQGKISFEDVDLPLNIKVLAIGFEVYQQTASSAELNLYLEPISLEGDGLEVVAQRIEQKASKITLQKQELTQTPGTQGDPIKVVQSMPGVVTGGGGLGGFIFLRGTNAGDNLYRMNHKPIGYLYHFGGLRSVVHPDLVKDFNIFLSGFPVEHGDNIGGSLDVLLRDPKSDRVHQSYSLGLYESSFLVEGPTPLTGERDSAYIAARRSYVDGVFALIELADVAQFDNVSFPVFHDVQANWHRQLDHGSIDLDYFRAGDSFGVYVPKDSAKTDPETAGQFSLSRGFDTVGLRWLQQWTPKLKTRLLTSYFYDRQKITVGANLITGQPYFLDRKGHELRMEPHADYHWNEKRKTTAGITTLYSWNPVKAYINQVGTQFSTPGSGNLSQADKYPVDNIIRGGLISPYVQHQETLGKLKLIAGSRYSIMGGSGGIRIYEFSPRLTSEYQWLDDLMINAHWGRFIKIPSGYYWAPGAGNPDLGAETAEHQSLGLQYRLNSLWKLQLEAYRKPLDNLVVDAPGNPAPDNFFNAGSGLAQGWDMLLKRDYRNGVIGWLSLSYVNTRRRNELTNNEFASNNDQPYTLVGVYSQTLPGDWNRWRLGLRMEWHTGARYTPVVNRQQLLAADSTPYWAPVYAERNSKQLPNYFRADLRLDRKFLFNTWSMNVYLDIWNTTVQKNISGYDYGEEYKDYANPKPVGFPAIPLPFFGIEATL